MSKKTKKHAEFINYFGPILEALKSLGGSAKPKEIADWIGEKYNLPDSVLSERYEKSGALKFPNQIAWGRQYLVWEELLESSKHGVWSLTEKGWKTKLDLEKSNGIFRKWVKVFADLRAKKDDLEISNKIKENLSEEVADEINIGLNKISLLEVLQSLSPTGFEHLCGRLLKEYNFENIEITQKSHDGGIDGYATLKLNSFVNISVFFQCKRYQGTVPTEKVQAFIGAMETNKRNVEKGLFITTGYFAKGALEIEKSNIKLELVDGEKLVDMFESIELGVVRKTIFEPDITFFEQYRNKY